MKSITYPTRLKKGIKGPAWLIVPISESHVDRAVFNGIVRHVLGKDMVETDEEFTKIARIKWNNEDQIEALLRESNIMVTSDPPPNSELQQIEEYIYKHFTWKPEDESPIGIGQY